jgi:transcriptional regulator GlxA family with amidase domain
VFGSAVLEGDYELVTVKGSPCGPRTAAGWAIATDGGLELLDGVETVIVAGWRDDLADPAPVLRQAIASAHRRGARIVSLCAGAFVLAAAGLLDHRRATTHWRHAADFRRRFPDVELDSSILYVDDGDVLTSAGTVAGIDLCLHIVRSDLGAQLANAVARRLVHAPHRFGSQAQFVERPTPARADARDEELLGWIDVHLTEPLPIERLAARAHLSVRQFSRRFKSRTGISPHEWILQQRVARAQQLLETTNLPIEELALVAGFGSPAALRLHFGRRVGTAPQHYRRAFANGHDAMARAGRA